MSSSALKKIGLAVSLSAATMGAQASQSIDDNAIARFEKATAIQAEIDQHLTPEQQAQIMADFNENRAVLNAANHFDQRYDQLIVDYGVDMNGPKPSSAELDKALHKLEVAYDFEDSCREKAIKSTLSSFNPLKNPMTALFNTGVAVTTGGLSIVGSGLSDMAGECIENKYGRMAGQGLATMVSGDVGSNMLTGALKTGAEMADRAIIDEKISAKEPDIKAPSAEASYIDQMIKDQDREGAKLNPAALDKIEQEILNSFTPEEKREVYSDYDNGPSM